MDSVTADDRNCLPHDGIYLPFPVMTVGDDDICKIWASFSTLA